MHARVSLSCADRALAGQVCTIFCARLDGTALGALLNVLVFGVKQLVQTVVYRGQLLVVTAKPAVSFSLRDERERERGRVASAG